jgi:release factor glutamine methyltransferase
LTGPGKHAEGKGEALTVESVLRLFVPLLASAGVENPLLDAQVLLSRVLKVERHQLIIDHRRRISAALFRRMEGLVKRRLGGEPVAYLTGRKEFYGLEFLVTRDVLIPRPETELLVDLAVFYAQPGGRVLDLGTGSGAIAISIKHARPDLEVDASDVSGAALRVARGNCRRVLKRNAVRFSMGDRFSPFTGRRFNIVVSNPPYVDPGMKNSLARELSFEPPIALYAGNGGTGLISEIIGGAAEHLEDGGILLLEIDPAHVKTVRDQAELNGFTISLFSDYAGLTRAAVLKK